MKIAFPYNSWRGGFLKSIKTAFNELGHNTFECEKYNSPLSNKILRRIKLSTIEKYATEINERRYNTEVLKQLFDFGPEIFFNMSGSNLFPETINSIKNELKCKTICFVADNPCDPSPHRDKYFAMTLKYYDILLLPEPIWTKMINNITSNSRIIPFYGGYDSDLFSPISLDSITSDDVQKYDCDVSFTGASYGTSAEGNYRASLLGDLSGYKVQIWGDSGWRYRMKFFPNMNKYYMGERLSYNDIKKLYTLSKINLNIPSPQILTGFQPRVFEIAAVKGFQLIDYSSALGNFFPRFEKITFKNQIDLNNKIKYFLNKQGERREIAEEMYHIVCKNYTWKNQIKSLIDMIC